ncbi:hypothetical protein MRX96_035505 [Rhipicephalus microplus]
MRHGETKGMRAERSGSLLGPRVRRQTEEKRASKGPAPVAGGPPENKQASALRPPGASATCPLALPQLRQKQLRLVRTVRRDRRCADVVFQGFSSRLAARR